MRRLLAMALLLVFAAVSLPVVFLSISGDRNIAEDTRTALTAGPEVKLLNCQSGQVIRLPLEQYVVGVVAAEMPAAFPLEALKAQAVASRTYTLRRIKPSNTGENPHPQADICTDHNHCQAWIDQGEMQKRWGKSYDENYSKICTAVAKTSGQAIYYNNTLIDPVYHSTSNGRTENSEDVWGTKVPYLRSVASRWDSASPKFHSTIEIPLEVISKRLCPSTGILQVSSNGNSGIIRPVEYTATGRLKTVSVAGRTIPCTQLRQTLGLPSTDLTWKISREKVVFNATGNGHGVGMSQYGAKGMAAEGYSWDEIIRYYYTGVDLKTAY